MQGRVRQANSYSDDTIKLLRKTTNEFLLSSQIELHLSFWGTCQNWSKSLWKPTTHHFSIFVPSSHAPCRHYEITESCAFLQFNLFLLFPIQLRFGVFVSNYPAALTWVGGQHEKDIINTKEAIYIFYINDKEAPEQLIGDNLYNIILRHVKYINIKVQNFLLSFQLGPNVGSSRPAMVEYHHDSYAMPTRT